MVASRFLLDEAGGVRRRRNPEIADDAMASQKGDFSYGVTQIMGMYPTQTGFPNRYAIAQVGHAFSLGATIRRGAMADAH